jgi:hypothetical protein
MMPVREIADTWASLYANSATLRSVISFAHVGGLVGGGGCAIAADLGALRALGHGPDALRLELHRVHLVHRVVITGLAVVVASGVLLMLADIDAYLLSVAFWTKMALVVGLVTNGAMLLRLTRRAEAGDALATAHLRVVSLTSLVLWFTTTLLGAVLPNVL